MQDTYQPTIKQITQVYSDTGALIDSYDGWQPPRPSAYGLDTVPCTEAAASVPTAPKP